MKQWLVVSERTSYRLGRNFVYTKFDRFVNILSA